MHVEFLHKFSSDLDKVNNAQVKKAALKVLVRVEAAKDISAIPNVKKLSGYKSAFRIRIGDYRLGIFVDGNTVQFARLVHRKDIYKVFP